jgi:hypothetical protein
VRRWGALFALTFVAACAPKVSDTGYVGTWARGSTYNTSTIAIHHGKDGYRFRWKVDSADGRWRVRCNWDGRCEEHVDGAKAAEYVFVTRQDPATGHLLVECTGKVSRPKPAEIHYLDELVVSPDGKELWSYSLERGGQRFQGDARPKRAFRKVANEVGELPREAERR